MKYIEIDRLKIFLKKIKEKKERIETNYFNSLNIFNDVLKTTNNERIIREITTRKQKLDIATNAAINTLDEVERKIQKALVEIEHDIENGNWENFDRARELANDIDRAASVNPADIFNNRLDYVKELRDTVEYGDNFSNEWKDAEISQFSSTISEFDKTLDDINRSFTFDSPKEVKAGLLNDEQYAFEDKLNNLERKLDREIEKLKIQGETLETHKDAILAAIYNLEKNAMGSGNIFGMSNTNKNADPQLYFSTLDKSVNNAVEKLDEASSKMSNAIALLSSEQIANFEKISLPLIKSLETTLNNLSTDVTSLKKENKDYRRQLDDYKKIVDNLTKDNREKEIELDSSYRSWMESTRKLNDLEEVIMEQSREIQVLDDDKNQIINDLEKKILDTSDFLTQTIYEKEMLMRENEELLLTIQRIKKEHEDAKNATIDEYVNTVSIQDLIEKEANKIVERKVDSLVNRYQDEIEKVKSNSIGYLLNNNKNENHVFDEIINDAEKQEFSKFNEQMKKFERKIANLETKIKYSDEIKEKNEDAINDINKLMGESTYSMVDEEKSYLSKKFHQLERKIEESLQRVTELEEQKEDAIKPEMTEQELNNLFMSSPLYGAIKTELQGMEKEVFTLKNENAKIAEENFVMTTVLDDTMRKITINSNKMKEIEDLLTQQEYEFMILNDEKNNVIDTLYAAIKDRDLSNMDDLGKLHSLDKYDFNDFAKRTLDEEQHNKFNNVDIMSYIKSEVEKVVGEELKHLKNKYNEELNKINLKYKAEQEKTTEENDLSKLDISNQNDFEEYLQNFKQDFDSSNLLGEQQEQPTVELDKLEKEKIPKKEVNNNTYHIETEPVEKEQIDGLDVSLDETNNVWDQEQKPNFEYIDKDTTQKAIDSLTNKNIELENKIIQLQEMISKKSDQQIFNSSMNEQLIYVHPQQKNNQQVNEYIELEKDEIYKDLKENQEKQLKEIQARLENSLGVMKDNQLKQLDKLNKKIDNIKVDSVDVVSGSVFDKYFMKDNSSNKYLEKEILESTDKLLKLQNLLLSLESEITREEKKVIVDL